MLNLSKAVALGVVDMKIDFNIDRGKKENTEEIINTVEPEFAVNKPVRSIATVRFENIKEYILDKN